MSEEGCSMGCCLGCIGMFCAPLWIPATIWLSLWACRYWGVHV